MQGGNAVFVLTSSDRGVSFESPESAAAIIGGMKEGTYLPPGFFAVLAARGRRSSQLTI